MFTITRPACTDRPVIRIGHEAAARAFLVNNLDTLAGLTVTRDIGWGPVDVTADFAIYTR